VVGRATVENAARRSVGVQNAHRPRSYQRKPSQTQEPAPGAAGAGILVVARSAGFVAETRLRDGGWTAADQSRIGGKQIGRGARPGRCRFI